MSQLSDPSCTSHPLLEPRHCYDDGACSLDFRHSLCCLVGSLYPSLYSWCLKPFRVRPFLFCFFPFFLKRCSISLLPIKVQLASF